MVCCSIHDHCHLMRVSIINPKIIDDNGLAELFVVLAQKDFQAIALY